MVSMLSAATAIDDKWDEDERQDRKRYMLSERERLKAEAQRKSQKGRSKKGKKSGKRKK